MNPFLAAMNGREVNCTSLVSGVGPVETAVRLTRFLLDTKENITGVLQFGVGGAYIQPESKQQAQLLDICLASQEVAGDLGICYPDRIEYLPQELTGNLVFDLDRRLLSRAEVIMQENSITAKIGAFITVNAISATGKRGEMLRVKWNGLCENMEGAATARVCREFGLPFVELRSVSNFVEDRNMATWQLQKACDRAGWAAACICKGSMTA